MGKQKEKTTTTSDIVHIPPVVTVLGHVDHGKTTLLDAIRKSTIAQKEAGGITQKIGASTIEILHEGVRRAITFIDTPGHQAFAAMRSRGALAADIGLLIVSATDGVMPQTKESIHVLQEAGIPIIVVITKIDLPEKNLEKVKQQLLKENVLLEGLGGDVALIEVSAKTNKNITELLGLILLVFEMHQDMVKDRAQDAPFQGIVIESKLDQRVGPRATIIVKNGTLRLREEIYSDQIKGKVRTLLDTQNKQIQQVSIGQAVEILGFEQTPPVGSVVLRGGFVPSAQQELINNKDASLPSFHRDEHALSIVLIADTLGSLEAITHALPKEIVVTMKKTGDIMSSDVFLAKSTKSIIIGFNVGVKGDIMQVARTEKVLIKNYAIIYELLDELQDVLDGKALAREEEIFGEAKILASFPFEKTKVLGIKVLGGRVAKGDKVRLMHEDSIGGESTITSVRQGKNTVSKIEQGSEGGVILAPFLDFTIGDVLICHR